jgi:hypothetical protein
MQKITALKGIRETSRIWLFGIGVVALLLLLPKSIVGQIDAREDVIGVLCLPFIPSAANNGS